MKKALIFYFLLLSCFCLSAYAKSTEQALDKIVAVVNDDVVTNSELNQALSITKMQIAQQQLPMPPEKTLQKQVLDQLINKKLQLQLAKQAGIRVTDEDLNGAIANVAKQNNMSVETLYDQLKVEGMTVADYRNEIRDQMTLHKLQQQEVINKITITPQEIAKFSKSKVWQRAGDETKEYLLEDILLPTSDTPSSEEIANLKKRAQSIAARLRKGQTLREVAQSEIHEKPALQSEELEWRKLPEVPTAFADQVAHMKAKEIAGPIQAGNGFHILILKGLRSSGGGTKEAALDKKQVEELLLQRKFEEALQTWVSKLRSQAYIEKNA